MIARLAFRRSALLSILFVVVYAGSSWLAEHRAHVGQWYFAWERHIPFWPIMIVPYLSIDAFFVAAPFLCRSREEIGVYTRRVTLAILVAGSCFLFVPLRFALDRPPANGWAGALLYSFVSLDRPYNLFPSLHVALDVILADIYLRRSSGVLRLISAAWFALIGVSTLFTYQHHVIDVIGGLVLGGLLCYLVVSRESRQVGGRNLRVAGYYLIGAALMAALMAAAWPWGAVLMWPVVSLVLAAGAYSGAGAQVFRKSNGTIPVVTRIVLGPCLAGQWLSFAYYRPRSRPFDEIAPGLWVGRRLTAAEARNAVSRGVAAVLDVSVELSESTVFMRLPYRNVPVLDLTAPTVPQLEDAVRFITRHVEKGVVYVHCKIGYSRSAAVAGAYLLSAGVASTTDDAIAVIRRARPSIVVRPEAIAALRTFEARLKGGVVPTRRSLDAAIVSNLVAGAARCMCGPPRWEGCSPTGARQRIYFANHTSHLDFPALWGSLPAEVREQTRPVAGRDYWNRNWLRRYLARQVFRAVLVDRRDSDTRADRDRVIAQARRSVGRAARALGAGASLIIFPEGTRGNGDGVGPFKSGLYHLCRLRPDIELVPVFLKDMDRILPKGATVPVPVIGSITFGQPIRWNPGEDKNAFLERARRALVEVRQPCSSSRIQLLRAS
jgi:protein-tyrosine phosphatase/1-acyl-sn-glycerol-3-phosphate acyltransferase/membrane-associated phospholipid phosphatase